MILYENGPVYQKCVFIVTNSYVSVLVQYMNVLFTLSFAL